MDDSRLDLVQDLVCVVASVQTLVVLVEEFNIVQQTLGESHCFAHGDDEFVSNTGEGSAEVEQ